MSQALDPAAADISTERMVPRGAHETFLVLAGLGFLAMAGFMVFYGLLGPRLTAGLDRACASAAFEAGKKLEGNGNYDAAIQRFRQAMEGHFASDEQRYMCGRSIGDILSRQNRHAEAIEAYEKLPAEAFEAAGSYAGYVTSLWRDGRLPEAEKLGEVWLRKAQNEEDSEQILWASNVLMHIADETGRPDVALAHAREITRIDPGSEAHLIIARILQGRGKYDEALRHIDTFLRNSANTQLIENAQQLQRQIQAAQAQS